MSKEVNNPRILISGGGTGGHVYPALAIADAIKARYSGAVIEFVGAEGRMEMEKVPQYGYNIHGLNIAGFQRKNLLKNISLPFKILSSLSKVRKIIRTFKPDAVVGVGGYASGPLIQVAAGRGIPALIQEQNSYPGITNKLLAKKVKKICVAYPGMEKFFPAEKLVMTGNPVRQFRPLDAGQKPQAYQYFSLDPNKKTVLVVGGSLGARSINEAIMYHLGEIKKSNFQLLWQTGKFYFPTIQSRVGELPSSIRIQPFIDRMDYAYGIADVVISRAGAISISELSLVGKASILIPSPNVAEDHQTKNARVLSDNHAAILVPDAKAKDELLDKVNALLDSNTDRKQLEQNIKKFGLPDAAAHVVDELIKLIQNN